MNLKQRIASLFLAFSLACTIPYFANASEPPIDTLQAPFFNDITDHWAESQIKAAVASGYVNGFEDGTFKPNASVTRAEFVKLLVGALKLDVETGSSPWYQGYVTAAKKAGIFADDFEGWNQPILRKEVAMLGVRGLTGYKQEYDMNRNLYEAAKAGILSGTAPGEIEPDGESTRAQAIVIIERVIAVKSGKTLTADKYAVAAAEVFWHKTNIFTMMPDIFNREGQQSAYTGINSWNVDNLKVGSPDGKVMGVLDELIAIDWNDPKDPNREMLPKTIKYGLGGAKTADLGANTPAYILLYKSHLTVNKDTEAYPVDRIQLNIGGFVSSTGDSKALDKPRGIRNEGVYGYVIPKNGLKVDNGMITISLANIPMPGLGSGNDRRILTSSWRD